jgi:hypothetical protein
MVPNVNQKVIPMSIETIEQRAHRLVSQEILCCMSYMVSTLAKGYGETHGDLGELSGQAFELSLPLPDYDETAFQAGWNNTPEGWTKPTDDDSGIDPLFSSSADACEFDGLEPYDREVFEHWAVTGWLADKLIAHGEKVDKNFAGLCIWARTTTGQAIAQDCVIKNIARGLI